MSNNNEKYYLLYNDCLRGQVVRKRTTDPEVGSSNPHEYQERGKGNSEITGGVGGGQ